jgi:hypothetical protein
MDNSKLQDFVTITVLHNRITFGDVRRLQRDYLPHGVTSRADAELLIRLDGMIERADRAWTDWLVAAVFDFAVFSERSVDAVASGTCEWLMDLLAALDISTKATRRLERDLQQALEPIAPIEFFEAVEIAEAVEGSEPAEPVTPVEQTIPFPAWHRAPSMVMAAARTDRLELAA